MEAKDTVTYTCICNANKGGVHAEHCQIYNKGKQAQAEISFKAGIKEVAECVNGFMVLHAPGMWRRKRKDWGIEWEEL